MRDAEGGTPLPACSCRAGRTAGLPATPRPAHRARGCTAGLGDSSAGLDRSDRGAAALSLPGPSPPRPPLTGRPSLPPALAVQRRLRGADGGPALPGNPAGGRPGAGAARPPAEVRLRARPAAALRKEKGSWGWGGRRLGPPSPLSCPSGCGKPRGGGGVSPPLDPQRGASR